MPLLISFSQRWQPQHCANPATSFFHPSMRLEGGSAAKRLPQINSSEERHAIEPTELTLKNGALPTASIWFSRLMAYRVLSYSLHTPLPGRLVPTKPRNAQFFTRLTDERYTDIVRLRIACITIFAPVHTLDVSIHVLCLYPALRSGQSRRNAISTLHMVHR
jgi:hypothetical protein